MPETNEAPNLPLPTTAELTEAEWQSLVKVVTQEARTLANRSWRIGFISLTRAFLVWFIGFFLFEGLMLFLLPEKWERLSGLPLIFVTLFTFSGTLNKAMRQAAKTKVAVLP